MSGDITTWALPRLSRLLPVDDESLKEVITYSASLPKEDAAAHLKNLLGDSPQAFDFISSFNSRRPEVTTTPSSATTFHGQDGGSASAAGHESSVSRPKKRAPKTAKPLHSAGPLRQPEGYGDVTGGYQKNAANDSYNRLPGTHTPSGRAISNVLSLSQEPAALQLAKASQQLHSPSPSSSSDPSPPRQKLPPSASGSLISDLPNVRTKQPKKTAQSGSSTPSKVVATTTTNINDLTAAIAALELSTNPSLSTERRKCPCNASVHPLFATAPNCLSCGKIICALEGLQPCSFCDSPILTREQVQGMIRVLKEERGKERMAAHNAGTGHSGSGSPTFGIRGGNTPESSGDDEASGAAARARAHRDKLLAFQRENAQRTKVHDEAADYDMTLTPGASLWMSPMQRAAALKKQQRYMREMQELNKPEWEKKKTVMSMRINDKGKLVKTYETVKAPTPTDPEPLDMEEAQTAELDSSDSPEEGTFRKNPLLSDGKLVRPIWRAPEGDRGQGREATTSQNKWRRVQDDEDYGNGGSMGSRISV